MKKLIAIACLIALPLAFAACDRNEPTTQKAAPGQETAPGGTTATPPAGKAPSGTTSPDTGLTGRGSTNMDTPTTTPRTGASPDVQTPGAGQSARPGTTTGQ